MMVKSLRYARPDVMSSNPNTSSTFFFNAGFPKENTFIHGVVITEQQDMQHRTTSEPYSSESYPPQRTWHGYVVYATFE